MSSLDTYADVLDHVYAAAVEPRLWANALDRLSELLGGSEANLIVQDEISCEGEGVYARSDPAALPLYFEHYIRCNPFLKTEHPAVPRVLTDEDKLPKAELLRTEYYSDFFRRFDIHSLLIARLAVESSRSAGITIVRPRRRDAFGAADIEIAERLHPHLVRAYRLSAGRTGECLWRDGAELLLEESSLAVFLLDDRDIVRQINAAGRALLARSRILSVSNGSLRAGTADATRRLHGLIARARENDGSRRTGGAMSLARDGHAALSITVVPVRGERFAFGTAEFRRGASVLVCVSDPDTKSGAPEQRLRELFALTPAEARLVVQLLDGREPREAAQRLGISYFTVRGHLARIFDKTGVNRQSQLIRLVTHAIGQLPE